MTTTDSHRARIISFAKLAGHCISGISYKYRLVVSAMLNNNIRLETVNRECERVKNRIPTT